MPYRAGRTTSEKVRPASSFTPTEQPLVGELAPGELAVNVPDGLLFIGKEGGSIGAIPSLVNGKVPAEQLPSYVDDVVEFANLAAFPATGETGKIYVAIDTARAYRWTGSVYFEVSQSAVTSVAGKTGAVELVASDITSGVFAKERLPAASGAMLGAVKQGARTSIASDGTISAVLVLVGAEPSAAVISVDGFRDIYDVTLTQNAMIGNPTTPTNGKTVRWRIRQDAVGGRVVTLDTKFVIPSSASNPLPWSTAPNAMDILAATYHQARDKWDVIGFIPGY